MRGEFATRGHGLPVAGAGGAGPGAWPPPAEVERHYRCPRVSLRVAILGHPRPGETGPDQGLVDEIDRSRLIACEQVRVRPERAEARGHELVKRRHHGRLTSHSWIVSVTVTVEPTVKPCSDSSRWFPAAPPPMPIAAAGRCPASGRGISGRSKTRMTPRDGT